MPKYNVTITTTVEYDYEVEAESIEGAEEAGEEEFKSEHPKLYADKIVARLES